MDRSPDAYDRNARDEWTRMHPETLAGPDLRYVCTDLICASLRMWTVGELVKELETAGFDLGARASKVVSDHLRTEVSRGRVRRHGWGRYGPGSMPESTRRRIRTRASLRRRWLAESGADADRAELEALLGIRR